MQEKKQNITKNDVKGTTTVAAVISLLIAAVVFSGLLSGTKGWSSAFDFITLSGTFGTIKAGATFVGNDGTGVKAGFLLALSLVPSVMLAMGVVSVVEHTGGLKVAQRLLTPVLRPVFGLPGNVSLALIASLQSTDAGAGMTKTLYDEGMITDKERTIFAQFQFSGCGAINNYLSIGSMVFANIIVPMILPLLVILVLKIFAANMTRLIINKFYPEDV